MHKSSLAAGRRFFLNGATQFRRATLKVIRPQAENQQDAVSGFA
jgi:hypothetical protein